MWVVLVMVIIFGWCQVYFGWRWLVVGSVSIFWDVVGGGGYILYSGGWWWICFRWCIYFEKWWIVMNLSWVVPGSGMFVFGDGG